MRLANSKGIKSKLSALDQRIGQVPHLVRVVQVDRRTGEKLERFVQAMDLLVDLTDEFRTESQLLEGIPPEEIVLDVGRPGPYPYKTVIVDFKEDPESPFRPMEAILIEQIAETRHARESAQ